MAFEYTHTQVPVRHAHMHTHTLGLLHMATVEVLIKNSLEKISPLEDKPNSRVKRGLRNQLHFQERKLRPR